MELLIGACKQRVQSLAFRYCLLHWVEIGFHEAGVQGVDLLDGTHVCYGHGIGAKPNNIAMLTMQLDVVDFGAALPDYEEAPEIGIGCEPWPRDAVEAVYPFIQRELDRQ